MTQLISVVESTEIDSVVPENKMEITAENVSIDMSKKRIWKNVFILGIAWTLLYTAYNAVSSLQSSLNVDDNVGLNSMSMIYGFMILSSILLPHPMINLFGMKWTIVICQFGYLAFIASNLYPKSILMYPSSILAGLVAAPLWASKGAYLTEISQIYSKIKQQQTSDKYIIRFFGIFFAIYETSHIWGNLISFFILRNNKLFNQKNNIEYFNNTNQNNLTKQSYQCGAQFLENEYQINDENIVPKNIVYTLCYIYIGIAILSIIIIIILLDQRQNKNKLKNNFGIMFKNTCSLFISTIKHLKHINQILLIPLTIWLGLQQGYLSAQFTKGFITCSSGIEYVGLILIVEGIFDAGTSFLIGYIVKYINRVYCLLFVTFLNYALIFTMLFWIPTFEQIWVLFIIAGLWGMSDGVWQTQIAATYGILFNEHEAAFSNFRLWESLGFFIAYLYAPRIRIRYSLIILICVLTLAIVFYCIIEILERRRKKLIKSDQSSSLQRIESNIITVF